MHPFYLYILPLSLRQNSKFYLSALELIHFHVQMQVWCVNLPLHRPISVVLEPSRPLSWSVFRGPEIKSGHFQDNITGMEYAERIVRKEPLSSLPTPTPHPQPSSVSSGLKWVQLKTGDYIYCPAHCFLMTQVKRVGDLILLPLRSLPNLGSLW